MITTEEIPDFVFDSNNNMKIPTTLKRIVGNGNGGRVPYGLLHNSPALQKYVQIMKQPNN